MLLINAVLVLLVRLCLPLCSPYCEEQIVSFISCYYFYFFMTCLEMNVYKGLGFLSSVAGALILLEVENFEFQGKTIGNLMIVGSSVCSAFNSLIQKSLLNSGIHPLVAQFYICLTGTPPPFIFSNSFSDPPSFFFFFA